MSEFLQNAKKTDNGKTDFLRILDSKFSEIHTMLQNHCYHSKKVRIAIDLIVAAAEVSSFAANEEFAGAENVEFLNTYGK